MGTGSLDLYGARFVQTGGTNRVSGTASIETIYWGPGVGTTRGSYTLSNGLFSVPSLVLSAGGGVALSANGEMREDADDKRR